MLIISSFPATGIQMLAFNRPEKRNALSKELIASFLSHLMVASLDPAIHAIVITGLGDYFSGRRDLCLRLHLPRTGRLMKISLQLALT